VRSQRERRFDGGEEGQVDKLKSLHSELDAGVRSTAAYTVERAVTDWLAEELPGRTAKTVEVNRDSLRPLLAVIGTIPLRDLTVQDVRTASRKMAGTHATRTLQKAHNCLARALREIAVEALRGQRRRQDRERAEAGELWQEHGLVFTTSVGTGYESHNLRPLADAQGHALMPM
jgi:hypothetical protein